MSPDPIGIFLAYLPVALVVLACLLSISLSSVALAFDAASRGSRRRGRDAPIAPERPSEVAPAAAPGTA